MECLQIQQWHKHYGGVGNYGSSLLDVVKIEYKGIYSEFIGWYFVYIMHYYVDLKSSDLLYVITFYEG